MSVDNNNAFTNQAVPSCLPESWQDNWDTASLSQRIWNTALSALDNVQNFISKIDVVPELLSQISGVSRVSLAISLPFRLVKIGDFFLALVNGTKKQPRVLSFCEIVVEIGNIMDDFSTFVGAVDKIAKVSATVNAVAQWIGFAGVILQVVQVPVDGYFIDKGVKILNRTEGNDLSGFITKSAENVHVKTVTTLSEKKITKITGKDGALDHLKKRIHFDISMRTIAIIFAVISVVAICLATFGVGAVVAAGVGIFAALAVSSLLLIPIEKVVNYAFHQEYKAIKHKEFMA